MEKEKITYIEFQKTRDFGSIIGDTFDFIVKNIKPFAKSVLIIMAPSFLILILWMSIFGVNIMNIYAGKLTALPPYFWVVLIAEVLLGIIYFVLLICLNYDYIKLYIDRKGGTISLGELWSEVKKDFLRVLLNLTGLFFLLGIFIALIAGIIAAIGAFLSEALAAVLGFLSVFILGTYFAAALYPVLFIIVQEKRRAFGAIIRSIKIVTGKWWFTFGLINVIMIVWGIFMTIVSIPYYIVVFFFAFHGFENMSGILLPALFTVTYIFLMFLGSLMYMIPLTSAALHFFNLRERKEASSLFAKVENLEEK
jgi:hypothetical protein